MPDPVDCADNWIQVQMSWEAWHPHWWRELKALYRSWLANNLSDTHALQFNGWQAAAFRLPLAKEEASAWWEASHGLGWLCLQKDFLPWVDSPGSRDFQVTRQDKTLPLAWSLQCGAESLGTPPKVLCDVAQDLQRCVAPLMWLEWNEIVEASLLGPTDNGPGAPQTSEEALL